MTCTLLPPGYLSERVADSSQCREEISQILNCSFQHDHHHHHHHHHHHRLHHHHQVYNSRVSDQNGVSLLYVMLEIHHSGWEPSICLLFNVYMFTDQQSFKKKLSDFSPFFSDHHHHHHHHYEEYICLLINDHLKNLCLSLCCFAASRGS